MQYAIAIIRLIMWPLGWLGLESGPLVFSP